MFRRVALLTIASALSTACQKSEAPSPQPDSPDDFQAVLNKLQNEGGGSPQGAPPLPAGHPGMGSTDEMPAGHPPVGEHTVRGHPPTGAAARDVPEGPLVAGTVSLGKAIKAPQVGSLFVMARPADAGHRGPPYFVQKIDSTSLPQSFELTLADAMMTGMPAPQSMHVQIRLDQDGDAISRTVGDVIGQTKEPVSIGAKGVKVVLTEVVTQEKPTRPVDVPVQ